MAKLIEEKEYQVEEGFEALIELSGDEYNAREKNPAAIRGVQVKSRDFYVAADCTVVVTGQAVQMKAGKPIKDVALAFGALRQGQPINVRERVAFKKGALILDGDLGEALKAQGHPVKEQKKGTAEAQADKAADKPADGQTDSAEAEAKAKATKTPAAKASK